MSRATGVTGATPSFYDPRKNHQGKYWQAVQKDIDVQRKNLGLAGRKGTGNPEPLKHPEGQ